MFNWKEDFNKQFGTSFALTPREVEKWAERIIGDLVKEIKRGREDVAVERAKNLELMAVINDLAEKNARLVTGRYPERLPEVT